jgi:hypothetical protein
MKRKGIMKIAAFFARTAALLAVLVLFASCAGEAGLETPREPGYMEGELLVGFEEGVSRERALEIIIGNGAEIISTMQGGEVYRIRLGSKRSVTEAAEEFKREDGVEYAEPNYIIRK